MTDPYVYKGTDILINTFNIKDANIVGKMEADFTQCRIHDMLINPIEGKFDFAHLCEFHRYIFQDVYVWAGNPRVINISKYEPILGGLSIEYEKHGKIKQSMDTILKEMNSLKWDNMNLQQKTEIFAQKMTDIWKVHCFREGNTRTTLLFCREFGKKHGIYLDNDFFKRNSVFVRLALVAASAKYSDIGDLSEPRHLLKVVSKSMQIGEQLITEKKGMEKWKASMTAHKPVQSQVERKERNVKSRDYIG